MNVEYDTFTDKQLLKIATRYLGEGSPEASAAVSLYILARNTVEQSQSKAEEKE